MLTPETHRGVTRDWNLTFCPQGAGDPILDAEPSFGRPVVLTVAWGLGAILGVIYAIITIVKYNSVPVFGKKVRTAHISNMYWICYFLCVAVASAVDLFRFEYHMPLRTDERDVYDIYMVLYGVTSCSLLMALNHQRKYRSKSTAVENVTRSDNTQRKNPCEYRHRLLIDSIILSVFVTFLGAGITTFCIHERIPWVDWFFFGAIVLLRVTCLVLGMVIVFDSRPDSNKYAGLDSALIADGPSFSTRACIFSAVVISTLIDVPPSMVDLALPSTCVFYYGTIYDIFQLLSLASMTLFFVVVRSEYHRNMEECIWSTVSLIQDAWQFNETF